MNMKSFLSFCLLTAIAALEADCGTYNRYEYPGNTPYSNTSPQYGFYCPPSSCYPCNSASDFVFADFLWWQANEDGLDLGKEVLIHRQGFDPATGNYALVSDDSKLKSLDFKCDPGFRIGIIYSDVTRCWDLLFSWTHFNTTASASGSSHLDPNVPPGNQYVAFVPFWEVLAQNFPDHMHGKWKLDLDILDMEFGRKFGINTLFAIRPYFGLRAVRVNQNYRVHSHANQSGDFNSASYTYTSKVKARCDFAGIGPRFGCDAELKMCWGFSLFGEAAGSLVWGKFQRNAHEHFKNLDFFFYKFAEFKEHTHTPDNNFRSRAITDLALGLKWENGIEWGCCLYPVSLSLSWEHHGFFDFNEFNFDSDSFTNTNQNAFDFGPYANLLSSPKKCGSLFTQGLTLSLMVGF